jgi:hypothetical protein
MKKANYKKLDFNNIIIFKRLFSLISALIIQAYFWLLFRLPAQEINGNKQEVANQENETRGFTHAAEAGTH